MQVKEAIAEYGKQHGYDGVCCDACGCRWDEFPLCGSICGGALGKVTESIECLWSGDCITEDGICFHDRDGWCETFEPKEEDE